MKNEYVKQGYHPSLIKGSVYLTKSTLLRKKTHDKNQAKYLSYLHITDSNQILPKPLGKIGISYRQTKNVNKCSKMN